MVRQFKIRLLNETFPDFRSWPSAFFDILKDSPFVRVLLGQELGLPASAIDPSEPLDAPVHLPVPSLDPFDGLLPGTAIAFMDGPPLRPSEQLPPGFAGLGVADRFQIQFSNNLLDRMVIDTLTMEILPPGRAGERGIGGGTNDMLVLAGPFDGPVALPGLAGLDALLLQGGASYDLTASDEQVGRGARLTIDGGRLGADDTLRFDGTGEVDGAFLFLGGAGDDIFFGGAGDDRVHGGRGADTLRGGSGADIFAYFAAGESSGAGHDTLLGFDPAADRIDLPVAVSGFDAAVRAGALSRASFDGDLAAALATLGAGRAVLFAPNGGDLAGTVFLVADGNGEAGYQPGEDYVFALGGASADLSLSTVIFV